MMFNGSGGMFFGGGFMLIFWIIIIVALVMLVKYFMTGNTGSQSEGPLDILKKRYARGEIDKEEFERRRKELE